MKKNKLKLVKTHDFSKSKEPKLAVVLIHGIASDSSTFDTALKYLEGLDSLKDVRFVTFDLLGSGKSPKNDDLNYTYDEQLEALSNSISDLELDVPLVLVGHSLGTFIVTRFASVYKDKVKRLVLISPPIYTEEDFDNPAFEAGIKLFKDAVSIKNRKILEDKAFNNSMENIVLDRKNYKVLVGLKTPAVLIYGIRDQFIGLHNFKRVFRDNPNFLSPMMTGDRHGVSHEKSIKLAKVLEEALNAEDL